MAEELTCQEPVKDVWYDMTGAWDACGEEPFVVVTDVQGAKAYCAKHVPVTALALLNEFGEAPEGTEVYPDPWKDYPEWKPPKAQRPYPEAAPF